MECYSGDLPNSKEAKECSAAGCPQYDTLELGRRPEQDRVDLLHDFYSDREADSLYAYGGLFSLNAPRDMWCKSSVVCISVVYIQSPSHTFNTSLSANSYNACAMFVSPSFATLIPFICALLISFICTVPTQILPQWLVVIVILPVQLPC